MATREGSLDAPTRHPLDWQSPDFWSRESLEKELERVFDICHGCRRCFNLCNAFPTLFDAVDGSPTGEVDGVPKQVFAEVVDQCYLCDMCYMSKCPYVPPHPFNVDFPHLMLRAKAVRFREEGAPLRSRILSATDTVGSIAGIPVVAEIVNAVNGNQAGRLLLEKTLGVARDAPIPRYESATARQRVARQPAAATTGRTGWRYHRQGDPVYDLLRQPQSASHGGRPGGGVPAQRHYGAAGRFRAVLRHAEARAGRPGFRREGEGSQRARAGEVGGGGLGYRGARALLRADVQAGIAADVSRRRVWSRPWPGRSSIPSITSSSAAQGRQAANRLQAARLARCPTTCRATCGYRTSA